MGSGLSRESSPEAPVTVRAPPHAPVLALTAYETGQTTRNGPTTTTPPVAATPVPAPPAEPELVPVPPPTLPVVENPRQHVGAVAHEDVAESAPAGSDDACSQSQEVADREHSQNSEDSLVPAAATAPAEQPHPHHDDDNPKQLPTPVAPPITSPAEEPMERTVSSSSPSISPPTSELDDHEATADVAEPTAAAPAAEQAMLSMDSPNPEDVTAVAGVAAAAGGDRRGAPLNGTTYRPLARSVSPANGLDQYSDLALQTVQSTLKTNHRVLRICLTGGPCAGKSTMLAQFQSKLPQRIGFDVYCVPEAATLLVTGGMRWDGDLAVDQQTALLRTQLALEDQFYALAVATGRPSIVFSDRGTMDGRAFCSDAQFSEILRRLDCTLETLRDRYDAVIHMVTAAIGAESYYNLDNPARYEDLDGARASDLKLREMYVGHPYFRLLDNSTPFDDKIEKGLRLAAQIAGVRTEAAEQPVTYHYLLRRACPLPLPVPCASYTTTTTILSNSRMDEIRLVYQRQMPDGSCMHFFRSLYKPSITTPPPPPPHGETGGNSSSFVRRSQSTHTSASSASVPSVSSTLHHSQHRKSIGAWSAQSSAAALATPQPRIDTCQRISSKEYVSLLNHRDPMREDVIAEATQFFHDNVSLELVTILSPNWATGKQTMTVECSAETMDRFTFPAFVEVDREVPLDASSTSFLISHRETGPLYTSLAFAPVFTRTVTAIGAHADVHDFPMSTCDSSTVQRAASQLNTPLRPLQSMRQNSFTAVGKRSAIATPVSADSSNLGPTPVPLPFANASVVAEAETSVLSDIAVDKENAVPARQPKQQQQQQQQQRTPLGPAPLFPARQNSSRTLTPTTTAMAEIAEGGEVAHTDAELEVKKTKKKPFSVTPLQQTVLPPIGERAPA